MHHIVIRYIRTYATSQPANSMRACMPCCPLARPAAPIHTPSLLIMSLYLGVGDRFSEENYINISAVLFMWCTLPAFGAAAYMPTLVLGKYGKSAVLLYVCAVPCRKLAA